MSYAKAVHGTAGPARARSVRLALSGVLAVAAGVSVPVAGATAAEPAIQVIRDADTGQLRAPTHEELKALKDRQAAQRKSATVEPRRGVVSGKVDPTPQRLSNGSRRVELDENSMSYSVVTRKPDGSLDMHCVTGAQAAERLVQGGSTASKGEAGHDH